MKLASIYDMLCVIMLAGLLIYSLDDARAIKDKLQALKASCPATQGATK